MEKDLKNVLVQSLDQIMSDRFGRYAKYIIQDRALPDARDGLKPVQRRIIFSMNELGLQHHKQFKKSARVVGDVIGKYHPHGDSSIYEAMVRMSQDWKMREPLVEMHGNNGSIDDDPAAAMRYTEARLSKISSLLLEGIDKKTVKFAPNFDDTEKEPTVLPGLVPNLLVNGARGIAAGYATEMPPHNLGEVLDAVIAKIKSPNARLATIMQFIKGPDFPTGGIVQGADGIQAAFERGRGKIIIKSKFEVVTNKTNPSITITEIPFGVVKAKLIRQMDEIAITKKIDGIKMVRDDTDRDGISIVVELTAGTDAEQVVNYLLSKTDLQVYYNYNNIAIVNGRPVEMGVSKIIDAYIEHQVDIQKKSITYDLDKNTRRLEIVQGLIRVGQDPDKIIDAIRKASGSKSGVVKTLMDKFKFTELQASSIAELRLYRLSSSDQSVYLDEEKELKVKIKDAKKLLDSNDDFNNYLISILKDVKKNFANPRRTVIEDGQITKIEFDAEALIKHEDAWVSVSREGYVKRFSNRIYESNKIEDFGLKSGDSLRYLEKTNTENKLLVFTRAGKFVFAPIHKLSEEKFKSEGKHINQIATIDPMDKVIDVLSVKDFDIPNAFVAFATKLGRGKRVKLSDLFQSRFSKASNAIKLKDGDELVGVSLTNGAKNFVVIAASGKAVKYTESHISVSGTTAGGMQVMGLSNGDSVKSLVLAGNDEVIGLISRRGGAKRIKVKNITSMSRTTQGKHMFNQPKSNPHYISDVKIVSPKDNAFFTLKDGKLKIVQFNSVDISKVSDGFSSVAPSSILGAFVRSTVPIRKESDFFKGGPEVGTDDEEFDKAAKKISQMSLDDLLEDI